MQISFMGVPCEQHTTIYYLHNARISQTAAEIVRWFVHTTLYGIVSWARTAAVKYSCADGGPVTERGTYGVYIRSPKFSPLFWSVRCGGESEVTNDPVCLTSSVHCCPVNFRQRYFDGNLCVVCFGAVPAVPCRIVDFFVCISFFRALFVRLFARSVLRVEKTAVSFR